MYQIIKIFMKRIIDIFLSILIILCSSWLLILIGCIQRFIFRSKIIFRQERVGENNKIFFCYKICTCNIPDFSNNKVKSKLLSKYTYFLRNYRIDEIPQFFNVIRGNMSIVGPRPLISEDISYYMKLIDNVNKRHIMKPGITGLSQISISERIPNTEEIIKNKIASDLWYCNNWTLFIDFKIIAITPFYLLLQKPIRFKS
jgi:putative colanic acid biosysnthesis UDP-glucose lipid carrier transferase